MTPQFSPVILQITFLTLNTFLIISARQDKYSYSRLDVSDIYKTSPIKYRPYNYSRIIPYIQGPYAAGAYPSVIVSTGDIDLKSPFEPILAPCEALLYGFTEVVNNFTTCVTANSLPPMVCTRCADMYVALQQAYYVLKDSTEAKDARGMPCDQIIFSFYDRVYVDDLYDVLTGDIWAASRCGDCLEFIISPQSTAEGLVVEGRPTGNFKYNNRTEKILSLHKQLFDCIEKSSGTKNVEFLKPKNASVVCNQCWRDYENMNLFYDESILLLINFCVDVDSAINDTIRYWRGELGCTLPALPTKNSEAVFVALIALALFALTILFYTGSFMQGTRRKRRLKKYRGRYHYTASNLTVNNDVVEEFIDERRRRQSVDSLLPRQSTERTPLLFSGGRRVISYSQLPPSNLG